jgi:hypothetical protein
MLSQGGEEYERDIFLRDRAVEMAHRHGRSVQFPDYGIVRVCERPSITITYSDPETVHRRDKYQTYYHLSIFTLPWPLGSVFSARWEPDAELEVIYFERGPWEEFFLS